MYIYIVEKKIVKLEREIRLRYIDDGASVI